MKATVPWLSALLLAGAAVPAVQADPYSICCRPAPDACGPGYYCTGPCGMVYGPNYCVRPGFEPFNGFVPPAFPHNPAMVSPQARCATPGLPPLPHYGFDPPRDPGYGAGYGPGGGGPLGSPLFPTHPYARGPRDYFMLEESDYASRVAYPSYTAPTAFYPSAATAAPAAPAYPTAPAPAPAPAPAAPAPAPLTPSP